MDSSPEITIVPNDVATPACEKPPLYRWVNDLGMRAVGRACVGVNRLLGSRAGGALGIITYHRIAPEIHGVPNPQHNVPPHRFRDQLSGLLNRGFAIWPLSRVLEYRASGATVPPRTVVVTFDDGFQSVYTNAWPVLRELQVPATLFLATAYLDSSDPFWFDRWGKLYRDRVPPESYRPLSSAQCQEMARQNLVELGAHTHTHQDFRGREEDFRSDLQVSVDIVRASFGEQDVPFAFPFGAVHQGYARGDLAMAARQTGVVCGLTTQSVLVDIRSDPFRWGRFTAFPWDTAETLTAKLHGWYSWAPRLRQQFARAFPGFRRRPRSSIQAFGQSSSSQWT